MSEHKIICPSCGETFEIDHADYLQIVQQVKTAEFAKELNHELSIREEAWSAKQAAAIRDAQSQAERKNQQLKLDLAEARQREDHLRSEAELARNRQELAVMKAVDEERVKSEKEIRELQEQLAYYKDLKSRASTKMVGESLEQHCLTEFNRVRAMAFPNAYFEKDNAVSATGSKGDFIFRESADGIELLSIMFEMKNETDSSGKKHKNEEFLRELDKDRREKECEYAVLVSLLEPDNDYYNDGIVDVSYKYPKMYIVRPQFFLPIISILRNAALNLQDTRRELAAYQNLNLDVRMFEENLQAFKDNASKNSDLARRQYQTALDEIDKAILHLQKVKEALQSSDRNLRLFDAKAEDLTIRKLTKNSPSVRRMFEES